MSILAKKPFIGRKSELERLNQLLALRRSAMVVIKGRRRVGKSRLVAEFAKDKAFLSFSGIPPTENVTAQSQYDSFARDLSKAFDLPMFRFDDWYEGFTCLERLLPDEPTVILFDEISWMGSKDPTFLPKLKTWWDRLSEKRHNIILVLCGSVSTWIEHNIIRSTGFFGRVSLHLTLTPLSLTESREMLISRGLNFSAYDTYRMLSVTGGIPWYLENTVSGHSVDDNIKRLCFLPNGLLVEEFDLIFHDLFDRRGDLYKKIINILAQGMRDYGQIQGELGFEKGGGLIPYLNNLISSGYITKHQSWSIATGKLSKKSLFRLSDNYLRFYLKVIEPNLTQINANRFENIPLSAVQGINSIMGFQVESLLLANRALLLKTAGIHPQDVVMDNPYFISPKSRQAGVQIDYLVQTVSKHLYLFEIKFSRNEIRSEVIDEVNEKIKRLGLSRGFAVSPILVHLNGVSDSVAESGYFYRMIDMNDLL